MTDLNWYCKTEIENTMMIFNDKNIIRQVIRGISLHLQGTGSATVKINVS